MGKNCFLGETDHQTTLADSRIVIVPVPFDLTSTWQKGADKGPKAILDASPNLEFYDIETDSEVYRRGIYTAEPVIADSPDKMIDAVCREVGAHLDENRFVVTLGGEHSVSLGAVKAHASRHKNLSVLQLDAHSDLRDEYHGSRFNHACVMARIKEICSVMQVGIRSMDASERSQVDAARMVFAHQIDASRHWIEGVVDELTEAVYVTIDLDVFDCGIMPSTGTPEPGGLNWYQVVTLLKAVSEQKKVVGFDVVELCPSESNKAPDFMAAKLVYTFLSYIWR